MKKRIVLGTRGSQLSLRQTEEVLLELKRACPGCEFVIQRIRTKGDKAKKKPLPEIGGKGLFVKEIEEALLSGEIDLAVHSFKDLPTELPARLEIIAFTRRLDPRDVFISRDHSTIEEMPEGSVIGTSSPRRTALIKAFYPKLVVKPIRGNVDTRLRKVLSGEFSGVVLAAAGLIRMGWEGYISQYLPPEEFVPPIGQGALAVEARSEDKEIKEMVKLIDHLPTRIAISAERAFLKQLGGGCHIPAAAYGRVKGGRLILVGLLALPSGEKVIREKMIGDVSSPEDLGKRLAESILNQGGREIKELIWQAKYIW